MKSSCKVLAGVAMVVFAQTAAWAAVDEDAANSLMKKSGCFKCHSLDKKKEGPPFKETAAKMKGKPDAEQKLYKHLTTHPKVKLEDGSEEEHSSLKTKDDAQIKNVIQWILTR